MPSPDDHLHVPACLAVVPVVLDDPEAPLGCAALRDLQGRPPLLWALTALLSSGVPTALAVPVPPALAEAVAGLVPPAPVPVAVLPVPTDGPASAVLAALGSPACVGDPGDVVVVHDPLHPLSSSVLVRDVVRGLLAEPDAAASVPAGVVTDTLKWVDGDEVVVGTADRASYAVVSSPQAYRRASLAAALAGADDETLRAQGAEVLPRLVQAGGGLVRLVPSPGEALRVATRQHIVLAEVLLQVGATGEGVS